MLLLVGYDGKSSSVSSSRGSGLATSLLITLFNALSSRWDISRPTSYSENNGLTRIFKIKSM